jgi:drug/metabolite transporter (DMT)-like permease
VVAVLLGWALAHEAVTWRTALGTFVILLSVALVSLRRRLSLRPLRKLDNTALRRH